MELIGTGFARSALDASFDFRALYSAGYLMRTHPSHLYDLAQQDRVQEALISPNGFLPFCHPSYEALVFAPFSTLKYQSAYLAFIGFNMLLLMAAFFGARPTFSSVIPLLQPRPGLMFFTFIPVFIAIVFGQDSILLFLLCCLAWRQMDRGKDASAGCLLALALFKFQIIIPMAILIAIWRGWRFSRGFLITSAGVVLLCIGAVGRAGMASWAEIISGAMSAANKNNAFAQHALAVHPIVMPNIAGLLYACGTRFASPQISLLLAGLCSFGLFVWCARMVSHREQHVAFSIAVLCGLLVSYHIGIYDLTLALLPAAMLRGPAQKYLLLALFGLPVVLLHLGSNWLFLLALPLAAMLVNAIVYSRPDVASEPASEPETLPAAA